MRQSIAILSILGLLASGNVMAGEIHDGVGHSIKPHNNDGAAAAMQQMYNTPASPTAEGTVLEIIDGAGYSYMEVEANNQRLWIAGTKTSAQKGDKIKYDENVVMENFFSKTLNRSFDRIVFASSVQVVK